MDSVNNSMLAEALERALQLTDRQRVVLTWSDKNQNKKREKSKLDMELSQLRLVLDYVKRTPAIGKVVYSDETGIYRGRHEVVRSVSLTWKERILVLFGGDVKVKAVVITEGTMGRIIEAAEISVGTQERDIMKNKKTEEKQENEKEDILEKVVESEPLEEQLRNNGTDAKEGGGEQSDKG